MCWQRVHYILPLLVLVGHCDFVRASRDCGEDILVKLGDANGGGEGVCLPNGNTDNFDLLPELGAPQSFFPSKYLVCEILNLTMTINRLDSRLFKFLASQSPARNWQLLRNQPFQKGSSFRRAAQEGVPLALGNTTLWVLREQVLARREREEALRERKAAITIIHFRLTIHRVRKTTSHGQVAGKKKIRTPPTVAPPTVGMKAMLHLVRGLVLSKRSHQLPPLVVPTRGRQPVVQWL